MCQACHRSARLPHDARWTIAFLCVCLYLVCFPTPTLAHKVTIFALVKGDTVFTQSKVGNKPAKNASVVINDTEGNQLLEGKTDEQGAFSFKIPNKKSLKVVVKASMGHQAEWTIPAEEITGIADVSESNTPQSNTDTAVQETARLADQEQFRPTTVGLTGEDVQELTDQPMDRNPAPVFVTLADSADQGPRVRDVIVGIGCILGLAAMALYFSRRKNRKET